MVELLVDGHTVHTKEELSFTLVRENPLLTRNGDYTYDIEISLYDPNNLKMYLPESRINGEGRHIARVAELRDNGNVICRGTEVILEKENADLKLQIVADNSEFNYLINHLSGNAENKIREMDFGKVECDAEMAASVVNSIYPQTNFICPPIFTKKEGEYTLFNHISVYYKDIEYDAEGKILPQPFLLFYIEKLITLLGYKIQENCLLREEKWRRLVLIHGYDTNEYAKMLPNWTVSQFVEEVEKFFNVVFLVDSVKKEVKIVSVRDWRTTQSIMCIDQKQIVDEFDKKFDEDEKGVFTDYANVKYTLPDTSYWKLLDIEPNIWKKVEIEEKYFDSVEVDIPNWDDFTVYKDPRTEVMYKVRINKGEGFTHKIKNRVQTFQRFISADKSDGVELKIIPAEIHCGECAAGSDGLNMGWFLYPVSEYSEVLEEDRGFYELIEEGEMADSAVDYLQVAFYAGVVGVRLPLGGEKAHYKDTALPMCFTTKYTIASGMMTCWEEGEIGCWDDKMTLELCGKNGRVANELNNDIVIAGGEVHVIRFLAKNKIDPTMIFNIKNRLYFCKQLKYEYKDGMLGDVIEGEFVPARHA